MPQVYNLTQYNPAQVDQQISQNRLRQMQAEQAEMQMQNQRKAQNALANLYTEEPVTERRVTDANALRPGPGGQQSGGGAGPSQDQMQRATEDVQVGTKRVFNRKAARDLAAADPEMYGTMMQIRQSQGEQQRAQEDSESAVTATVLQQVEQSPDKEQAYQRAKQYLQRNGVDTSDFPEQYDPMVLRAAMGRVAASGIDIPDMGGGQGQFELRNVGDRLVRVNPQTGETETLDQARGGGGQGDMPSAVREAMFITGGDEEAARQYLQQQNADTGADTQRARQIRQTMDTYGVPRTTAQGIVDGIIDTETDPVTGNTYLVNKIDGSARRLDYSDTGQDQGQQQGQEPGQGNARAAQQLGENDTLWSSTEGVAGVSGAVTEAYERVAGQVPGLGGGEETQETVGNRQFFRLAQNDLIRSLSINPRFPVGEMNRIQRETDIEPNVFDSQDSLKRRMRQLDRYLTRRLKNERRASNNRELAAETRQNARAAAKDIRNFLDILGVPNKGSNRRGAQTSGSVGSRRDTRQQNNQSQNLTVNRIKKMSRQQLDSLNANEMTREQLEAASERYDALQGQQ